MKKLYIDQQGIIKVINVPEEPKFIDIMEYVENCLNDKAMKEYKQALAAAKEVGIEVENQEQATAIIWKDRTGLPLPNNQIYFKRDTVHDLPEGWRVEIKITCEEILCKEPSHQVAVLLPPVSEKVESQEELWKAVSKEINEEGLWIYEDWDGFRITKKGIAIPQ